MTSITRQRNRDFLRLCQQRAETLRREGRYGSIEDIVDYVLTNPAPRYYADQARIYTKMRKALGGEAITNRNELYFEDMLRDLREAMEKYPNDSMRLNLMRLTAGICGSPRFYIRRRTAISMASQYFDYYVA